MSRESIIVPEGIPFIAGFAILALIFGYWHFSKWAVACFILMLFVAWFFRNPERKAPEGESLVISPADGKVIKIEDVNVDSLVRGSFKKISIFMNVFNVHVNRAPYGGTVKTIRYTKGKFFSANLDKASSLNEQNAIVISTDQGKEILTVQIAGLIARRIVCWIKEGMQLEKGERFGLIRFGSRLDVYLPQDAKVTVNLGDKVRAGESPLGELP